VVSREISNVCVITPAYNEWSNLRHLYDQMRQALDYLNAQSRWVIVCEEEPPVDSIEQIRGLDQWISVIPRSTDRTSFADALQIGLDALGRDDDVVVFMDGDNSHNPFQIPRMIEVLSQDDKVDVVVSSRYVEGGSSENSAVLKIMSRALNIVFRLVLRMNVRDLSTNFKAYRADLLRGAQLNSKNFEAVEEILLIAQFNKKTKLQILEIPDYFRARLHGQSKRKLGQFIGSYLIAVVRMRKRIREQSVSHTSYRNEAGCETDHA
jgi:dolichol-phosphate mannosyltransferase